ncbi:hypothetical protein F5Y04DRAFT_277557 [Hypomontagnella monticulosa]|nr:hypothetical protein F5Y04DRAFT_277557 [Hypomontagnella monticulosa]
MTRTATIDETRALVSYGAPNEKRAHTPARASRQSRPAFQTPPSLKREDCSSWAAEKRAEASESKVPGSILKQRTYPWVKSPNKKVRFADQKATKAELEEKRTHDRNEEHSQAKDKFGKPFDANLFSRYGKTAQAAEETSSEDESDQERSRRHKGSHHHSRRSPEEQERRHREGKAHARPGTPESPLAYMSEQKHRHRHGHRKHSPPPPQPTYSPSPPTSSSFTLPYMPPVPTPPPTVYPWGPPAPEPTPSPELSSVRPRSRHHHHEREKRLSLSSRLDALAASSPEMQPPPARRGSDVNSMVVEVDREEDEERRRRRHSHHHHHRHRHHEHHEHDEYDERDDHDDHDEHSRHHGHHRHRRHHSADRARSADRACCSVRHHSRRFSRHEEDDGRIHGETYEERSSDGDGSPRGRRWFRLSGLFFKERYAQSGTQSAPW